MNAADRIIPLTPPGPLWSQREYVACLALGIGFAAHRAGELGQFFHYGFPGDLGCVTVEVVGERLVRYVDHEFPRELGWIKRCAGAMAAERVAA